MPAPTSWCCCAPCSVLWSLLEAPHWAPRTRGALLPRCCQRTWPAQQYNSSQTCRLKPRHQQRHRQKHRQRLWQICRPRVSPAIIQVGLMPYFYFYFYCFHCFNISVFMRGKWSFLLISKTFWGGWLSAKAESMERLKSHTEENIHTNKTSSNNKQCIKKSI